MVYMRDVAQVRDGNPPQTNIVHVDGNRSVLMHGAEERLGLDAGDHRRRQGSGSPRLKRPLPPNLKIALLGDQSLFVNGGDRRRGRARA